MQLGFLLVILLSLHEVADFAAVFLLISRAKEKGVARGQGNSNNGTLNSGDFVSQSTAGGDGLTGVKDAATYTLALSQQIVCTKQRSCSEYDRVQWLRDMMEVKRLINVSRRYTPYKGAMLCRDVQSAGFLLEEESAVWPMACLWTGSDGNGTCAPAPPSDRIIDYVVPEVWGHKLKQLRTAIRCSPEEIAMANEVDELYICRNRCIESGIGYLPSIVMAASVLTMLALIVGNGS